MCVRSGFRMASPSAAVRRKRTKTSSISERMLTSGTASSTGAGGASARGCETPLPSTQSEKSGLLERLIGSLCFTTL